MKLRSHAIHDETLKCSKKKDSLWTKQSSALVVYIKSTTCKSCTISYERYNLSYRQTHCEEFALVFFELKVIFFTLCMKTLTFNFVAAVDLLYLIHIL